MQLIVNVSSKVFTNDYNCEPLSSPSINPSLIPTSSLHRHVDCILELMILKPKFIPKASCLIQLLGT